MGGAKVMRIWCTGIAFAILGVSALPAAATGDRGGSRHERDDGDRGGWHDDRRDGFRGDWRHGRHHGNWDHVRHGPRDWFGDGRGGRAGGVWFDGEGFDVRVPYSVIAELGRPKLVGNELVFRSPQYASAGNPFAYLASLVLRADPGYTLSSIGVDVTGAFGGRRDVATYSVSVLDRADRSELARGVLDTQWQRNGRGGTFAASDTFALNDATSVLVSFAGQGLTGNGRRSFIDEQLITFNVNLSTMQIPEAEQWALLLAGLGVAAWAIRRRA